MITIDPGTFRHRVLIRQQATVQDDFGQQQRTFLDVHSRWANIRAASSREVYATSGFISELTHIITVRYSASAVPTPGMKVRFRDRSYEIQAVSDPDESRVVLNLYCVERA